MHHKFYHRSPTLDNFFGFLVCSRYTTKGSTGQYREDGGKSQGLGGYPGVPMAAAREFYHHLSLKPHARTIFVAYCVFSVFQVDNTERMEQGACTGPTMKEVQVWWGTPGFLWQLQENSNFQPHAQTIFCGLLCSRHSILQW